MREFFQEVRHTTIVKAKGVSRTHAIRLYCEQTAATWNLQVRGPATRADGREGSAFIVATASCSADDLRALRDAIDKHLAGVP